MIKITFTIDITGMIGTTPYELNYKEKSFSFIGDDKETISFRLRTIIDRRYNQKFNKHQDFFKKIFIIEKYNDTNSTRVVPVYPAEEFKLLASSVGGRDNLKLGRLVGAYNKLYPRDIVEVYYY
ncbi:unnamed protein product [marine sediment metagenome]|uniref:Uncharacterized protein n=1 Tax=marine sediment metagenome TaxID=412755 RepID=X0UQ98_9ZZZZ